MKRTILAGILALLAVCGCQDGLDPNPVPKFFTITSMGNTSVSIQAKGAPDPVSLEYKLGDGDWTAYTIGTEQALADGETLQFRAGEGGNETFSKDEMNRYTISVDGEGTIKASGNMMSLLDPTLQRNSMPIYGFTFFFMACDKLIDVSELDLAATTMADWCYSGLFHGCTSMTAPPALPATTLALRCYDNIFCNCSALATAPALPATTLANLCYNGMFQNCHALTTAPALPATKLARSCYCSMFHNCTSLTTAPELPATTLAERCYASMFMSCSSLTTAPALPATTLVTECYEMMFQGCTNLNYIKMMAIDISAQGCLNKWVNYVPSPTGTFIKNKGATWDVTGISGIPSGWTVKTE